MVGFKLTGAMKEGTTATDLVLRVVQMLREKPGIHAHLPAIKAVGYRQIWSFLEGEIDEQTMIKSALAATRQLAKRQHTWLRSWKNLNLLAEPNTQQALKIVINSTILE